MTNIDSASTVGFPSLAPKKTDLKIEEFVALPSGGFKMCLFQSVIGSLCFSGIGKL